MFPVRSFAVVLVLSVGFRVGPAVGEPGATSADREAAAKRADVEIDRALRGRAYEQAVGLIDAALPGSEGAAKEYLVFRRGLALLFGGKAAEAVAQFEGQLGEFPDGAWAQKARFRKADGHVELKEFEAAERIYAEQVRALIGDERKARIAQVYLDFAKEYFKPADSLVPPEYEKARTFYERALALEPGEALRDEIVYRRALCNQKLGQWGEAAGQYEEYLLLFDEVYRALRKARDLGAALPRAAARRGEHILAARLGMGECRLAMGRYADARRALRDLVSLIDLSSAVDERLDRTWVKATYQLSKTYRLPEPSEGEALTLGVQALERLLGRFPGSKEAIQAAHEIGAAHAHLGRHDEAIRAYRALIDRTVIRPGDDKTRRLAETLSQDALFNIGRLLFAQKKYADAIGVWNQYVAKYPTGPNWSAAQRSIVDTEFQIGADAVAEDRYDDARQAWTAFLQKYPLDGRAAEILYRFGDLAHREQERLEKAGKTPNWSEPIGHWKKLVNKFPNTDESGLAQYMIGLVLEQKMGDLEGAIDAYRKLTWSEWAKEAQRRTAAMKAVRLRLLTERSYRTDEPATVQVDTRNIDTLTVKLYRIDMEDYFRKSHSLRGVESLDLLLIDPDKTFDAAVEGYAKYKPVTQKIEIPFEGPGVWAVNVSNERAGKVKGGVQARKLEATTLVVRSDIDVIIKSSRRQMLVFAENMRARTPAAGVRVLVSDGRRVVLEGETGEDGVWLGKPKKAWDADGLSVFAMFEGHVAGDTLSLSGLQHSSGLQPRGYIYTDRPTYRPGQAVNIRGILREVRDGRYSLPAEPEDERLRWKLDVVDAKGRVLRTEALALSGYGSFATQFRIAADAPVGEYKLIARRVEGPTFSGAFGVQTYQLPKAYLQFDFKERVVMRGEKIGGAVVAMYHYGEPVVGKTVEYQMHLPTGDLLKRSGVTDDAGKVPFEFDSTVLPEEGAVAFSARQADLDIGATSQVFVAVRAFGATVKTIRPLYLSEEPVEVAVETRDLLGEPVAKAMRLTALLRTEGNGQWAETKVESVEVETEAETGTGRASLKLVKGGMYVLRAEGEDRLGHVVSAETTVRVSDEKDATRLRLFSERQHYKVGELIGLDMHSRIEDSPNGKPGGSDAGGGERGWLALLTCEGEEVVSYRTLRVSPGHNRFELPVGHEHFPNMAVHVAVMSGNRFYAASRDFSVERRLTVVMKPDRTTYRPRDEMTVEIEVTDQQGRPVQAEVGLAMIDNALLTRYPDRAPNIVAFFKEGAHRTAAARTATSCTFRYQGQTRLMVTEVLAEARRLEEAEEAVEELASVLNRVRRGWRGYDAAAPTVDMWSVVREEEHGAINTLEGRRGGFGGGRFLAGAEVQLGEKLEGEEGRGDALLAFGDAPALGKRLVRSYGVGDLRIEMPDFRARGELAGKAVERYALGRQLQLRVDAVNKSVLSSIDAGVPMAEELGRRVGALIRGAPPRTYYPEVAYWNPRVETGADGKATVKIVLPDSSTKWRLIARGATPETLVGRGEAEVICKHDFVVELLTPATLVQGDRTQLRAQVHCLTPYRGKIDVMLKVVADGGGPDVAGEGDRGDGGGLPRRDSRQGGGAEEGLSVQKRTIEVDGSGVFDVVFDEITVPDCGRLVAELSAETQEAVPEAKRKLADAVTVAMVVRPWGMRVEAHASGVAKDSDFVEIALPQREGVEGAYHDLQLTVAVGPSMQRWLITEALERGPRWEFIERSQIRWHAAPPRTHADTASSLLACLYASDYLRAQQGDQGRTATADARLLNERIAGLIAQLLSAQKDNGGWPWCGRDANPDPWTTSQIAWALGKARRDGHSVADEAMRALGSYLRTRYADARTGQTELKAVTLHGIAWVDEADYAHANRLYRNRRSLSNAALGHLALTFVRLDRRSIAAELLAVLAERMKEVRRGVKTCRAVPNNGNSAWMNSELEVTALALLAQLSVDPRATSVRPLVDYLVTSARAGGWRPHKAKGTVLAALATYFGRSESQRANYRLAVSVNGRPVRDLTSEEGGSVRIDVGEEALKDGKQRVDFAFSGRGEYAYAVTLSGFSRQFPTRDETRNRMMRVDDRHVAPPPLEYKGRIVKAGFSAAEDYKHFRNEARHLPVASVAEVSVYLRRYDASETAAGDRDYIVVQETIPAGFRLLTDTIQGEHLAHDYADNLLTLYYGSRKHLGTMRYKMVATTPGTYRPGPTVIRSLYRPEIVHVNKADAVLTVLPRDAESPDEYRMTPDEFYTLGRLHFEDGDHAAAAELLKALIAGKWVIKDEPYRESVRMLLDAALARNDADEIVDYFEILKEKYPDLVIPFEKIVAVADAYGRTGQHERGYLIYRATADASFVRDSNVGGVLQEEGRFLESIDFLEDLWRDYPDTPQVASVYYALSQALYAKAEDPRSVAPRPRAAGDAGGRVTRASIVMETIRLLESFLSLYPEDPAADEASYSLANAYLDLDDFRTVIGRTGQMAELFPESKWLDRFRYVQALAHFNLGDFKKALGLAQQVAASTYRDEQGVVRPSPNKWLALYIIGQIYHAQQETAKAIEYYKKVKSHFSDAEDLVGYFEHKYVALPEVTVFHPDAGGYREASEWADHLRNGTATGAAPAPGSRGGGAEPRPSAAKPGPRLYAGPFVEISHRNITSAVLQVYRVDLIKLALVEKNLTQITSVNLAGIKPILEKRVRLGDGHDYVDKAMRVELDASAAAGERADAERGEADASGAYLVICRGDDLFTSGLVLVTPLAVEVQEDPASQRARVNVVNAIDRSGLKNVHVKVIGTGMGTFVSGETDLRGVYVAEGVSGFPTAIARDGVGHFAFYRSPSAVLAMAEPPAQVVDKAPSKGGRPRARRKADYRSNLRADVQIIQDGSSLLLQGVLSQEQRGVQVQQAEEASAPQFRKGPGKGGRR